MVALTQRGTATIVGRESYKDIYRTVSGREGTRIIVEPVVTSFSFGKNVILDRCTFTTAPSTAVGFVLQTNAPAYDPDFVKSVLAADAAKPEAGFSNVVDMLDWLNRD